MSEDPIGLAGGINPSIFGGGDPVNGRDPSGLHHEEECATVTVYKLNNSEWIAEESVECRTKKHPIGHRGRTPDPGEGDYPCPQCPPGDRSGPGRNGGSDGDGGVLRTVWNFISHPCTRAGAGTVAIGFVDFFPGMNLAEAGWKGLKAFGTRWMDPSALLRQQAHANARGALRRALPESTLAFSLTSAVEADAWMIGDLAPGSWLGFAAGFVPGVSLGQSLVSTAQICAETL